MSFPEFADIAKIITSPLNKIGGLRQPPHGFQLIRCLLFFLKVPAERAVVFPSTGYARFNFAGRKSVHRYSPCVGYTRAISNLGEKSTGPVLAAAEDPCPALMLWITGGSPSYTWRTRA